MHELEQNGGRTSFAAAGPRLGVWHALGQYLEGEMTAEEAMRAAHMNRRIFIEPVTVPDETQWAIPRLYHVILEGEAGLDEEGELYEIPAKVVGVHGEGGAAAHAEFSMRDRFDIAEFTLHASKGEAVWSSAGMLRDGTQGFACMRAPDIIIDPNGLNDIIASHATVSWSFDGSRATELGASFVRTVCANTLRAHDNNKSTVIKVKHTSATAAERMALAATHWAKAQDEAKALRLMAEELLRVQGARLQLNRLVERFDPKPKDDSSKRTKSLWQRRQDQRDLVFHSPTNDVGDNGWKAYNTWTEWLDWVADVKCAADKTEADCRYGNQFDGVHDDAKRAAAALILA